MFSVLHRDISLLFGFCWSIGFGLIYHCDLITLVYFLFFLLIVRRRVGVLASSNVNGNNGSLATVENRTSFTNHSHYNGTINELIVSETIPIHDGVDATHAADVQASLPSLSLTRINNTSDIVSTGDGALSNGNDVQMQTVTHARAAETIPPQTTQTTSVVTTIAPSATIAEIAFTTIAPMTGGTHTANHMQTSQSIASSNTRRDSSSSSSTAATASTLPITSNKPRKYPHLCERKSHKK